MKSGKWLAGISCMVLTITLVACNGEKPSPDSTATTLICSDENSRTKMEIFSNSLTWDASDSLQKYLIITESDVRYIAREVDSPSEYAAEVSMNRVTGETIWTARISNEARLLVTQLCRSEITEKECSSKMRATVGGNSFACFTTDEDCERAERGNNVIAQHRMTCLPRAF